MRTDNTEIKTRTIYPNGERTLSPNTGKPWYGLVEIKQVQTKSNRDDNTRKSSRNIK